VSYELRVNSLRTLRFFVSFASYSSIFLDAEFAKNAQRTQRKLPATGKCKSQNVKLRKQQATGFRQLAMNQEAKEGVLKQLLSVSLPAGRFLSFNFFLIPLIQIVDF